MYAYLSLGMDVHGNKKLLRFWAIPVQRFAVPKCCETEVILAPVELTHS